MNHQNSHALQSCPSALRSGSIAGIMGKDSASENVTEVVPFFRTADMVRSLAFYCDGLGFETQEKWIWEGTIRWCCLKRGGCRIMLQDCR